MLAKMRIERTADKVGVVLLLAILITVIVRVSLFGFEHDGSAAPNILDGAILLVGGVTLLVVYALRFRHIEETRGRSVLSVILALLLIYQGINSFMSIG